VDFVVAAGLIGQVSLPRVHLDGRGQRLDAAAGRQDFASLAQERILVWRIVHVGLVSPVAALAGSSGHRQNLILPTLTEPRNRTTVESAL
jgi:hypothetical protein